MIDRDNVKRARAAIANAGAALRNTAQLTPMEMRAAIECTLIVSDEATHKFYGSDAESMIGAARAVAVEIQNDAQG